MTVQFIDDVRIYSVPVSGPARLGCHRGTMVMAREEGKRWEVRFIGSADEFNHFVEQEGILIRVGRLASRITGAMRPTSYAAHLQRSLDTAGIVSAATLIGLGFTAYGWTPAQLSVLAPSQRSGLTPIHSNSGACVGRHIKKNLDVMAMVSESILIKSALKDRGFPGSTIYCARPVNVGQVSRPTHSFQPDLQSSIAG